jgi:hypothetical protein
MYELYGCYDRANSNIESEDDQNEKKTSLLILRTNGAAKVIDNQWVPGVVGS